MRFIPDVVPRTIALLAIWLMGVHVSRGHPASGIVVDRAGQVYFLHTGVGIWKIDGKGQLHRLGGPSHHFLALDAGGSFKDQRWPRYREEFSPGIFRRYGDGVIETVGRQPTLITASSFPIVIGSDGALYYPEPWTDERVHIKRMAPGERPSDFATLPAAFEINYNFETQRVPWIHGLAADSKGALYYAEKESVLRIDRDGTVSPVAANIKVPGCVHGTNHRGGPILRGLDVTANGVVYVAAMGCGAVVRIPPEGTTDVALRSENSWTPTDVATRENDVYVLEYWFTERAEDWRPRVRRLSRDGSIAVLATITEGS